MVLPSALLERGATRGVVPELPGRRVPAPADGATSRDAALAGVTVEPLDDGRVAEIRGEIGGGNMDAVPLEKAAQGGRLRPAQRGAVGRRGDHGAQLRRHQVREDLGPGGARARSSSSYDWLHLHHEDFTGQYSKFFLNYAGAPWLVEMVEQQPGHGAAAGLPLGAGGEAGGGGRHRASTWSSGGFLFAMCTATETLDLALAADGVDIAAAYADGTPMDPRRDRRRWTGTGRWRSRTRGWS